MACMLASFSEGLMLADRSGLSKDDLIKILSLGAMNAPIFAVKGPKMVADGASTGCRNVPPFMSFHLLTQRNPSHTPPPRPTTDHAPNFPLKHAQKDLAFSLTLASQLGVEAKTAAAANGERGVWCTPSVNLRCRDLIGPSHHQQPHQSSTRRRWRPATGSWTSPRWPAQ